MASLTPSTTTPSTVLYNLRIPLPLLPTDLREDAAHLTSHNNSTPIININDSVEAVISLNGNTIKNISISPAKKPHHYENGINCHGGYLIPGLVDGHLHLQSMGRMKRRIDVRTCRSENEVITRLSAESFAKKEDRKKNEWIFGRGWDQNLWDKNRYPTLDKLSEAFPLSPVWLERIDGHCVWLNDKALTLLNINSFPKEMMGSSIFYDDISKEGQRFTGILLDEAMELARKHLPCDSYDIVKQDLLSGMAQCAAVGLTAVHDMGMTVAEFKVLCNIASSTHLRVDVTAYLLYSEDALLFANGVATGNINIPKQLILGGIKIFLDGALGSHGAALMKPYCDQPDSDGLLLLSEKQLVERLIKIEHYGLQAAIHAIGDNAVHIALNAIEKVRGKVPHRIEHSEMISDADVARFSALRVIAGLQPAHALTDCTWLPSRLGAQRATSCFRWNSLHHTHALQIFGSDAPIEHISPWWGIAAATGTKLYTTELQPESLSLETVLPLYQKNSYAERCNTLAVGRSPHFTIVDKNPFTMPAENLPSLQTLATWVAGHYLKNSC